MVPAQGGQDRGPDPDRGLAGTGGDEEEIDCGIFEISNLKLSGPPGRLVISALSSLVTKPFKREKKNFPWMNTNLRTVAGQIAARNGFALFWEAGAEGEAGLRIDREDQRNQSDAAFLTKLAGKRGFNVKVQGEKLIVYSARKCDARPPVRVIERAGGRVKTWSLETEAHDVYRACRVEYYNPDLKKHLTHTFTPENRPPRPPARSTWSGANASPRPRPSSGPETNSARSTERRPRAP